ncbi:hypothetical protein D477_017724 [Arthrobacter crystallopoietes BAB-32]|uniref:MFS transporter n=1 Tax=Arthrobacter crystallopoietes BAB-32 TaxID=1246476 RepID=N1UYI1_9MICC|nr:MFS transporter [Arthrobacter crystallopoietes]EMY32887.1 hypothetical protein D477_017724 [Arthrobacter crystallopoietes BAB-32]
MPAPASLAALTPKVVIGFLGTWVLALLAANLVPVLIGALVADLGMSVAAASALATAMSLGTAAGIFATNKLVAKGDRPRIARIGLLAMAAGFGLGAFTLTTAPVVAGVVLGGIGAGVVVATATAASSATRDPDKTVNTVMIVNRLAAAALLAIVPLLGSDLRNILVILAGLGLVGLLSASGLPNLPIEAAQKPAAGRRFESKAVILALVFGLWSMTEDLVYAISGVIGMESAGMTLDGISLVISLSVVGGLLGALASPLALKLLGRSLAIVLIITIGSVCKYAVLTATSAAILSAGIVLAGTMYGAVLALVFGLAARMDVTGRVGTLVMGVYIVGVALGPVIGGNLIGAVSAPVLGLAIGIPSLAFGALLFVISRRSGVAERGGALAEAAEGHQPAAATVE